MQRGPDHTDEAMRHLPLTAIAFDVLLSLAGGARHGYAMLREMEERTGVARVNAGTLYRAIGRLVDSGLVTEREDRPAAKSDDARRRYYALTALGRRVAAAEAARLEARVATARARRLLARSRTT
ncbi:MAG: PadR family transcriptional regulator [Gemmatimonadetes bacterium]|nr:PadR family transcriptional regulator [Gemmatimonadota bacterium]